MSDIIEELKKLREQYLQAAQNAEMTRIANYGAAQGVQKAIDDILAMPVEPSVQKPFTPQESTEGL
jgi:hypothetical protein